MKKYFLFILCSQVMIIASAQQKVTVKEYKKLLQPTRSLIRILYRILLKFILITDSTDTPISQFRRNGKLWSSRMITSK
jgi:hypothetical protein